MSFVVLHADRFTTALATDPIVPAAEVETVRDTIALFEAAGRLRGEAQASVDQAREIGHAQGYAEGRLEGRAAGEEEVRAELLRLTREAQAEEARRRAELARLALEVVRHIAGEIGEPATVAGLAQRAVATVSPDLAVTVRVPPAAVAEVSARLADRPGLTVEGDSALGGADCIVETFLGRTHAGLETQLAQIERVWREVPHGG